MERTETNPVEGDRDREIQTIFGSISVVCESFSISHLGQLKQIHRSAFYTALMHDSSLTKIPWDTGY